MIRQCMAFLAAVTQSKNPYLNAFLGCALLAALVGLIITCLVQRVGFSDGTIWIYHILNSSNFIHDPHFVRYLDFILQIPAVLALKIFGPDISKSLVIDLLSGPYTFHPIISLFVCWKLLRHFKATEHMIWPLLCFFVGTQLALALAPATSALSVSIFWPFLIILTFSSLNSTRSRLTLLLLSLALVLSYETGLTFFILFILTALLRAYGSLQNLDKKVALVFSGLWLAAILYMASALFSARDYNEFSAMYAIKMSQASPHYWFAGITVFLLPLFYFITNRQKIRNTILGLYGIIAVGIFVVMLFEESFRLQYQIRYNRIYTIPVALAFGTYYLSQIFLFNKQPVFRKALIAPLLFGIIFTTYNDIRSSAQWHNGNVQIKKLTSRLADGCHFIPHLELFNELENHQFGVHTITTRAMVYADSNNIKNLIFTDFPFLSTPVNGCENFNGQKFKQWFLEVDVTTSDRFSYGRALKNGFYASTLENKKTLAVALGDNNSVIDNYPRLSDYIINIQSGETLTRDGVSQALEFIKSFKGARKPSLVLLEHFDHEKNIVNELQNLALSKNIELVLMSLKDQDELAHFKVPVSEAYDSLFSNLNYSDHIQPLINRSCATCHQENGIAEYFRLASYKDLVAHKSHISNLVEARVMPPWKAEIGVQNYKYDYSLTDFERAVLLNWLKEPLQGQTAQLESQKPRTYRHPQSINKEDFKLYFPGPVYQPKARQSELRCFAFDWPENQTQFITDFTTDPFPNFVHHMVGIYLPPEGVESLQSLSHNQLKNGFDCSGRGVEGISDHAKLLFSSRQPYFPENSGFEIEPGSKIILQYHFETSHIEKPEGSLPGIYYKIESQVQNPILSASANMDFDKISIPPNEKKSLSMELQVRELLKKDVDSVDIISLRVHAHNLFTSGRLWAVSADNKVTDLLRLRGNIFADTDNYVLDKPFRLSSNDRLMAQCDFDNTSHNVARPLKNGQPIEVEGGWYVHNEMCAWTVLFTLTQQKSSLH